MSGRAIAVLVVALFLVMAAPSSAVVTTVVQYRLGDADPGATAGAVADNPTVDSMGVLNLTRFGAPTYLTSPFGLGVHFAGSPDGYSAAANPTTVTDNFGIEAWVRPDATAAGAVIAYNGSTSTSGWGLYDAGGMPAALFGGVTLWGGSTPLAAGAWTHVAVVRSGGVAALYVNGTPVATSSSAPATPAAVAGSAGFMVGANITGSEYFPGSIDEVRVFTFAPGAFQLSDLNDRLPAVPALSMVGLGVLAALVLLGGAAWLIRA